MKLPVLITLIALIAPVICWRYLSTVVARSFPRVVNWRGAAVPVGTGILIPVVFLVMSVVFFFGAGGILRNIVPLLYLIFGVSFFGALDDLVGDPGTKGLKGHIKSALRGKITTGFLKAASGVLLSLLVAFQIGANIIISGFSLALTINFFNLLDRFPGRALKIFIFLSFLILPFFINKDLLPIWGTAFGLAIVLLIVDIKEDGMLGDIGSNGLGALMGYMLLISLPVGFHIGLLVLVLSLNLLAEKISFSEVIDRVTFLRFIDKWGVGEKKAF